MIEYEPEVTITMKEYDALRAAAARAKGHVKLSVSIPRDLWDRAREKADAVSPSIVIRAALTAYVEETN